MRSRLGSTSRWLERKHLRFRNENGGRVVFRKPSSGWLPWPAWRCRATPDAARHEQRRKTLHDVMELAAKFFADTLASRNGALRHAAISATARSRRRRSCSRLGYAPPDRFALKEHLGAQGISTEDMVEAGSSDRWRRYSGAEYDRFRDRVMFPFRYKRPCHRLRRPRAGKGRSGKVPELAGNAAVSQGRQSLQPLHRAAGDA